MDSELKALIVDDSPIRAAIIEDGLREAGFTRVQRLDTTDRLIARIGEIDPDIVVIDLANPQRDTLEQIFPATLYGGLYGQGPDRRALPWQPVEFARR